MTDTSKSLDPDNWPAFRYRAHKMLDAAIDKMENTRTGRVWNPPSDELLKTFEHGLSGLTPDAIDAALVSLLPFGVGNTHPRFMGWVHGSGTPSGLMAEIIAGAINANCGGRNHAAIEIERQVVGWARDVMGYPKSSSGLILSGTSMATIVALKVARDAAMNFASRSAGVMATNLVGYTSSDAHSCVVRAFDMLGLGSNSLRKIPVDENFQMDLGELQNSIRRDRANNITPFCVIGSAGTINTGAIDPLDSLADIATENGLWFHIDGAFGACGMLSHSISPRLKGIERSDSLAFDFHKWMHVNYDAGCVLVRDESAHRRSFSSRPDYLAEASEGLAANNPWPVEYGPELSRGFRALKIWAQIAEHGTKLGSLIDQTCDLATYLAKKVDQTLCFQRLAPTSLQIVCFRAAPESLSSEDALNELNSHIVTQLQLDGVAAPSTTRIDGKTAIRVNLTNHRTRREDLDMLINAIEDILRTKGYLPQA